MTRRFIAIACIVAAPAAFFAFNASIASAADINGCSANVQNPHPSTKAAGIITKTVDTCTLGPTEVVRDVGGTGLFLWVCPTKGSNSELWITTNCTVKGVGQDNCYLAAGGDQCTRYAPPESEPGAHGSGWWIACETFESNGPNGVSNENTYFSNWVQLTG